MRTFKELFEKDYEKQRKIGLSGSQQVFTFKKKDNKKVSILYNVKGNVIYFKLPEHNEVIDIKFNSRVPKNQRDAESEIFNYLSDSSY